MATIKKFEDIYAWQKAQELAVCVYSEFKGSKDFSFRDQICRAVVSISNNIAEGFDRSSDAEFSRFLYYSKGSCSEVKSMLYLAGNLNYINIEQQGKLIMQCEEISKLIQGFIKALSTKHK